MSVRELASALILAILASGMASGQSPDVLRERLAATRSRAAALYNDGAAADSLQMCRKALGEARQQLRDHPDLARAIDAALRSAEGKPTVDAQAWALNQFVAKLDKELERLEAPELLQRRAEEAAKASDLDGAARLYLQAIAGYTRQKTPNNDRHAEACAGLGQVYVRARRYADALPPLSEAIARGADRPAVRAARARVLAKTGSYDGMLDDYAAAIRLDPQAHTIYDEYAWQLATCPDPLIRDGKQALTLATKACALSHERNAWYFDTVAAAYAELEDFDAAIRTLRKAIDAAEELPEAQVNSLRTRLQQYEKEQPTRSVEVPPPGVDFALKVVLPTRADLRLVAVAPAPGLPDDFTRLPSPQAPNVRAVWLGKALADEPARATRTVKVALSFSVGAQREQFDLEYHLVRGETRWVDARSIIDEWTRTVELLRMP